MARMIWARLPTTGRPEAAPRAGAAAAPRVGGWGGAAPRAGACAVATPAQKYAATPAETSQFSNTRRTLIFAPRSKSVRRSLVVCQGFRQAASTYGRSA